MTPAISEPGMPTEYGPVCLFPPTKDGKLNPAATVVSAFALRLHTNLPTSQFVSNFRGGVAFKLI